MVMVPENCVSVEICSWVKPEVDPLLPIALPMSIDVGLDCIRLSSSVPQELKIKLITYCISVRVHLPKTKTKTTGQLINNNKNKNQKNPEFSLGF